MQDWKKWKQDTEIQIARRILPRVKRATSSRTMRRFLQVYVDYKLRTVIGVPHYWAVYYNDGRGGFGPKNASYLVWFPKNALEDDPRLGGRWPVNPEDFRPLTKEEFQLILEINKEVYGEFSTPEFGMITRWSGPARGKFFFEAGFKGSSEPAHAVAKRRMASLTRKYAVKKEKSATIQI